jgi:hypothetical protein
MTHKAKDKIGVPEKIEDELLEKYSSAISLSDLEIFIFPDLLYSLVLANIMSPEIWKWRDDPWFAKIDKMNPYRRVLRLKQYIIDHYDFNLDLDSWGLTTKDEELDRFRPSMDVDTITESNALFGYTGDKYYFDMDIRKHFGLDKYTTDTIPYWKTETVEAMNAFKFREGYELGAGECVSLSTMYAAALFIVCKIPLEDIFLVATPLHSQNFLDIKEGVLTNNRRVVTKNMWFNGTELTARAQRALRNEQVTIVAHNTGNIHTVYEDASIDQEAYKKFEEKLSSFLSTKLDLELLSNFLRHHSQLQKCFQIKHVYHGRPRWIAAEKVYSYEHGSSFKASDNTKDKLLEEIDEYEFFCEPIEGRIPLCKFEEFFKINPNIDLDKERFQKKLMEEFNCYNAKAWEILQDLRSFIKVEPRLPHQGKEKNFVNVPPILLETTMNREEVISAVETLRPDHPVADLAFYAYRDMNRCDWAPFLKAAFERNPVTTQANKELDQDALIEVFQSLENDSIYDGPRLAQPDEVWNFQRGDGAEKAVALASVLKNRHPEKQIGLKVSGSKASVLFDGKEVAFDTVKGLSFDSAL